jgi:hypothetical protein
MLSRDAGGDQLRGDSFLSAVALNPHFAVADVYVQDAPVNAVDAVPAAVNQFVMIVRFVKEDFRFDVASRRFELGLMPDQLTNDAAILVQCFHLTIICHSAP